MYQRTFKIAAICAAFVTILGTGPGSAQSVIVDDFNDGIFDEWSLSDFTADEAWGPGVMGINGKGELVLASRRPIPTERDFGLLTATWDEGENQQFTDGVVRARVRVENASTLTGVLMRTTGTAETGFSNYAFSIAPRTRGTNYCIHRVANTRFADGKCVDRPIPFGEDLYLEASAVGDQLSLKIWPTNDAEPANPQVRWTDSRLTSGTLGLYAARNDGQGDVFFDSNFAAIYDDLVFTPADTSNLGGAVPEPTSGWLATLSLVLLVASCRRNVKSSLRTAATVLLGVTLASGAAHESIAQASFDLGDLEVSSEDPNDGNLTLSIPAGKYNAYTLTADWSKVDDSGDPWSEEAIWAIANGPLYDEGTTFYADPGISPDFRRDAQPTTIEWTGMLDLPLTGATDIQLLNYQSYDEPNRNFDALWANTELDLTYVTPPAPPRLDAHLGVIAGSFAAFEIDTLTSNFDTELGIYSETGQLVAQNDDLVRGPAEAGSPQSHIDFHLGLPAGNYFAAVGGFNTIFNDEFSVATGADRGNYTLTTPRNSTTGSLADDGLAYIAFTISDGDFDHDRQLSAADVDRLIAEIKTPNSSLSFDLNADGAVDQKDIQVWTADLKGTWIGDANLDGQFNSEDLIVALAAGTYEAAIDAGWESGDFDGSGRFDSNDLIVALADGGYEQGPRAAIAAVPEPTAATSAWLVVVTMLGVFRNGRRHSS